LPHKNGTKDILYINYYFRGVSRVVINKKEIFLFIANGLGDRLNVITRGVARGAVGEQIE